MIHETHYVRGYLRRRPISMANSSQIGGIRRRCARLLSGFLFASGSACFPLGMYGANVLLHVSFLIISLLSVSGFSLGICVVPCDLCGTEDASSVIFFLLTFLVVTGRSRETEEFNEGVTDVFRPLARLPVVDGIACCIVLGCRTCCDGIGPGRSLGSTPQTKVASSVKVMPSCTSAKTALTVR